VGKKGDADWGDQALEREEEKDGNRAPGTTLFGGGDKIRQGSKRETRRQRSRLLRLRFNSGKGGGERESFVKGKGKKKTESK